MSWLFSQALVAAYLEATCSDGEQSVPLNGSHTQLAYCAPDKMTAFSRLSRFGMTYKHLTENRGEELLTRYLAGFHAKTSAQQEKEKDLTESAAECGSTWQGSWVKYDHDTCSWKTHQCSLIEEEQESLQTLPKSGMTANGLLWERPMLEHRTKENVYGFWPTPMTKGMCGGMGSWELLKKNTTIEEARHMGAGNGGKLNPMWVEWLMGWPLGWTDLKPLEMDKFRQWQQQHGAQ